MRSPEEAERSHFQKGSRWAPRQSGRRRAHLSTGPPAAATHKGARPAPGPASAVRLLSPERRVRTQSARMNGPARAPGNLPPRRGRTLTGRGCRRVGAERLLEAGGPRLGAPSSAVSRAALPPVPGPAEAPLPSLATRLRRPPAPAGQSRAGPAA